MMSLRLTEKDGRKKGVLMSIEAKFTLTLVLVLVVILVVIPVCIINTVDKPACMAQTSDIGLPSRWSFWGGCQVEISEGRWIPLDNWYYVEKK
jgi:hypothetical protein